MTSTFRLAPASAVLASALLLAAPGAMAQHTVYFGAAYVTLHTGDVPLTGGPATPAPAEITIDNASAVRFGYIYRVDDRWSAELILGIPPTLKGYGRGLIAPFGQVSSAKEIAPSVFVNYHFGELVPKLRPFVGAGINYTKFIDAHSTASGNAASGGPTALSLDDSWGWAAHVGFTYQVDDKWSLIGAVSAAHVASTATSVTTTNAGTIVRKADIDFKPVAYNFFVGYSF